MADSSGAPPQAKYRIIIIDDEEQNLELLQRALHGRYIVDAFSNANQALEMVQAGSTYDLALVDQRMPGMTGLEFLTQLRETHPRTMRMLLTGYTETDDLIAAINRGEVYRYIVKPWVAKDLHVEIRHALERYELERGRDRLLEELARANNALRLANQHLDEQVRQRNRRLADTVGTLSAAYERFALAVRAVHDGLWDWDLENNVIQFSNRWKAMLGFQPDDLGSAPKDWFGRVHPDDLDGLRTKLDAYTASGGGEEQLVAEYRILDASGEYRWVLCRGLVLRDESGKTVRVAGSQTDLSEYGFLDRLTNLPTRTVFLDRLDTILRRAKRNTELHFAVLAIDIDGFRLANEVHGRPVGDAVLCEVAERLTEAFRLSDTVAHLGADRFVTILEEMNEVSDSLRAVERMRAIVERPLIIENKEVRLSVSVGVAVSSSGYGRANDMLADAETALRDAKTRGGRCTIVFDEEVNTRSVAQLQLDREIRTALEREQFCLYFQPIMSLATDRPVSVEALIRWQHPERGLVFPDSFIPVAEKTGLIRDVDTWVMAEACKRIKDLQTAVDPPLSVSVNVSGRQLHQSGILETVSTALELTGLDPHRLTVELTETVLIEDVEASMQMLAELKKLGIRLALDDFGTGYSSLGYLNRFPVDVIKVDRSFVMAMVEERHTATIVQSIITLANSLGKDVTAEGVEDSMHLAMLRDMGCHFAQGYYFAKPLPVGQLCVRLDELNK